jgi:hypothetical protein
MTRLRGPHAPRAVFLAGWAYASARGARDRAGTARGTLAARRALISAVVAYLLTQAAARQAVLAEALPVGDPIWQDKFARLQAGPPPERIAVGSSRTQLAVKAGDLPSTFNFGTPAGGPLTCHLYVRRLLAAGHRPRSVLLELHPGFLTPGDPPFEARWLHPCRLRGDEVVALRALGWTVPTPPQDTWRGHLAATTVWRLGLLDGYARTWLPCPFGLTPAGRGDRHGWVPGVDLPAAERPRALAETRAHYAAALDQFRVGGAGCAAVRATVELCRAHDIAVTLLLAPESSEHRGWYGPGYADVTAFARSLGAPLIDAREWLPDAQIADGHHLTPAGAAAFTARLAREWP